MTREEAIKHLLKFAEDNKYKSDGIGFLSGLISVALYNPWHKASEELPKEGQHILMAHTMRNGDYMTEAIWYPEPGITDNMEYWMEIPEIKEG